MRILIAEDDLASRRLLQALLVNWGYEVVAAADGDDAWQIFQEEDPPLLAILDWMMPGLDGIELCRRVRHTDALQSTYIILLTARDRKEDMVAGLESGADDYMIKPFSSNELRARVRVGLRVVKLQVDLAERVKELEQALVQVKQLEGYLPICSYCKRIRNDKNYWQQVEQYIESRSDAFFTHSICPECYKKYVEPELEELKRKRRSAPKVSETTSV